MIVQPQSKISRTFRGTVGLVRSKRDYVEDLAVNYDSGLTKLTQRRKRLVAAIAFGVLGTAVVWIMALRFPYFVSTVYSYGLNSDMPRIGTLLTILLMSIPFAPPFVSVFALSNLLSPSSPEPEISSEVMSSFEYGRQSGKRTLILIVAGMVGALNCLLLVIALISATGH